MSKFILFTKGVLSARYDGSINSTIPTEAIEVDDELFFQTINEQDGVWSLVDGEVVKKPFPPKTLAEAKVEKLAEIKEAYLDAADAPVEAIGFTFDGGFDSAIKLDAAMRLSQAAGADSVVFFDASNAGHNLGFDDALQVCIAVAVAYQTALARKQGLFNSVQSIEVSENVTEAQVIAAVEAIVWEQLS